MILIFSEVMCFRSRIDNQMQSLIDDGTGREAHLVKTITRHEGEIESKPLSGTEFRRPEVVAFDLRGARY